MPKTIFRQEAVDRMASPEQLDELMPVTSPRGWIALAGLSVLLVLGIAWGFLGKIETAVEGTGVLVRPEGMDVVVTLEDGVIKKVYVKTGDLVRKGDPLFDLLPDGPGAKVKTVPSVEPGRVLDVRVIKGDPVKKDNVILTMDFPEQPLQAIVYVPATAKDGYQVREGQTVQVFPAKGDPLFGKVVSAGSFPATRTAMQRSLQNPDWSNEILQKGPVLEVVVDLPDTERTAKLYSGISCEAVITISNRKPVSFVLPIFDTKDERK